MLGNLLPLPGGIGGVDGGMIGAFAAFGVDAGLAVVAVLAYRGVRLLAADAPRGAVAYFQLRRTVARWRGRAPGREGGPPAPARYRCLGRIAILSEVCLSASRT